MRLAAIFAGLGIAFLAVSSSPVRAQGSDPAKSLFESANQERAAHDLAPLKWNPALAGAAQQHAQRMAAENTLSHQLPGEPGMVDRASQAGARFLSLAENVAKGSTVENVHKKWMNSPLHRANLLNPHFDSLGIAVTERGGVLFAMEVFSLAAEDLSLEEQEGIVSAKLQARGLRLSSDNQDARRSCLLDKGYTGSLAPPFVLHYTKPDLQTLPEILEQRIRTGSYHTAVVAACSGGAKTGFSQYRIVVLLYE